MSVPRLARWRRRAGAGALLGFALLLLQPAAVAGPGLSDAAQLSDGQAKRVLAQATVRVLGLGCGAIQSGSGTAYADGRTLTNRHVVDGSRAVRVMRSWDWAMGPAEVSSSADVALVGARFPGPDLELSLWDPGPGAWVTVAGHPYGRSLNVIGTNVVDYMDGRELGQTGRLMRIGLDPAPGMSGGPVLDGSGRLAGIVFATEEISGYGLVIPASTLRRALSEPAESMPPTCPSRSGGPVR
jgi:S1-C subfamily serine protease